jgi:hypothetical protein
MGNLWTSPKVRPVPGTYLEERPRRRPRNRVASFMPLPAPPALTVVRHNPPVRYKEKALRICHEIALRSQAFNGRVVGSI